MNTESQPRRYRARHLKDAQKLSEAEIAEQLGTSQPTASRDLASTVPPKGYTKQGTPFYPPGRFDDDPEYIARVDELTRDMPRTNARRHAAREFSGAIDLPRPSYVVSPNRH